MTRREMLKMTATVALAVTAVEAYDNKLIVNKENMKPTDPKKMTKAELKHTPLITLGSKDKAGYTLVEITVGHEEIIHPSTDKHWIYEIELYADDKKIDTVALEPVLSRGYLGTRVKLDGIKTLKAIAKCNLHGNWESVHALA